jgi:hypothetical protein
VLCRMVGLETSGGRLDRALKEARMDHTIFEGEADPPFRSQLCHSLSF